MRTVAGDSRLNAKHKRPNSGLIGWAAAWSLLERIEDDTHRELLSRLVRTAGIHGAPALKHLTGRLRFLAGVGDYTPTPGQLSPDEAAHIERRAKELLAPHVAVFPKMRKLS